MEPRLLDDEETGAGQPTPPPMRNGKHWVVLLAGGPADIARDVATHLSNAWPVEVRHHLESDKTKAWQRPLPKDVDFVVLLKDFCGHAQEYMLRTACKGEGLLVIKTQSKRIPLMGALRQRGIGGKPLPRQGPRSLEAAEELKVVPLPAPPLPPPAPVVVVLPDPPLPKVASEELMLLAMRLWGMCKREGISAMVTPKNFTLDAAA